MSGNTTHPRIERPTADGQRDIPIDDVFSLLSDKRRRYTLYYFSNGGDDTDVQALAAWITERESGTPGQPDDRVATATALHHTHLPRLADAGVIEYDRENGTVQYRGDDRLERWADYAESEERVRTEP